MIRAARNPTACGLAAMLGCIGLAIPADALGGQAPVMQNTDLLDRIDKDMSRFPFDMQEAEARTLDLPGVHYREDEFGILVDAAGVRHDFYEGLYSKTLAIDPAAPAQDIAALGIGQLRQREDVLAAFAGYSGGKTMECEHSYAMAEDGVTMIAGEELYCHFVFDPDFDAVVSLTFTPDDRLKEIYVQAWNPF